LGYADGVVEVWLRRLAPRLDGLLVRVPEVEVENKGHKVDAPLQALAGF